MGLRLTLQPSFRAEEDAAPLAWTRIGLGLVTVFKAWHLATMIASLSGAAAIRVPHFWGFSPGWVGLTTLCLALAASGLALALGRFSRAAAAITSALLTATLLADRQLYANHLYLLILLTALLALSDCGATLSLDARRVRRPDQQQRPRIASWPATLLRLQATIVYCFAATAKLNESYLSGEALRSFVDDSLAASWPTSTWQALSLGSIVGELFVGLGLWFASTRRWAAAIGVALHVGMVMLIDYPLPLLLFAAEMLLLYPLFFSSTLFSNGRKSD